MGEFDEIFEHVAIHTLLGLDRLTVLYGFSRHASQLEGDIAEVGAYRGGSSVLLARSNRHKTVHVFDTFAGIPNAKADSDVHDNGDFDLGGNIPAILTAETNICVHQGFFPQTAPDKWRYCFAHFDGDTYESCLAFIAYFRPRMSTGGMMVFDDYRWHKCPGVARALQESFTDRQIIPTASIQAMVIV